MQRVYFPEESSVQGQEQPQQTLSCLGSAIHNLHGPAVLVTVPSIAFCTLPVDLSLFPSGCSQVVVARNAYAEETLHKYSPI